MDSLIILQHSPVYTLGRRGDVTNFLFSQNEETQGLLKRGGGASQSPGERWMLGRREVMPVSDLVGERRGTTSSAAVLDTD
jgi:hypothetical protein